MFNNTLKMNPLADAVRKVMEADEVKKVADTKHVPPPKSVSKHDPYKKNPYEVDNMSDRQLRRREMGESKVDDMKDRLAAAKEKKADSYEFGKDKKSEAKPRAVAGSSYGGSKQKDIEESKVDDMKDRLAAAKEKKADSYEFGKDKKSEAKPRAVSGSSYGGSKQKDVEESFASRLIARAKEINEAKSSGTEPTFTDNNMGETISRSAKAGDYIDDFVHSKNPKFANKSKKERINMALGAYYGKKNEEYISEEIYNFNIDPTTGQMKDDVELLVSGYDRKLKGKEVIMIEEESDCVTPPQAKNIADKEVDKHEKKMHDKKADLVKKEEVEQIDELKTGTLMRYATKANQSMIGGDRSKEDKRIKGIHLATNKIKQRSQKSVKEEEQIDELSKKTLKSYMSKAVDSDLGMPKHSKNPEARMKGIGAAHKKLLQEPQKSVHESNDHHTHAAHYEDPKTGEWTGMSLLSAKSDEDAIHQAHKMCKAGCRLSKVERHIAVKEDVEHIKEKLGKKETIDTLKGREGKVPLEAKISNAHTSHKVELKSEDIGPDGSEGWKDKPKANKDKSGAVHSPMSRVKHLAKQAMKKINKDHGMKNETMMGKISN